jgi:hypothetical protein
MAKPAVGMIRGESRVAPGRRLAARRRPVVTDELPTWPSCDARGRTAATCGRFATHQIGGIMGGWCMPLQLIHRPMNGDVRVSRLSGKWSSGLG